METDARENSLVNFLHKFKNLKDYKMNGKCIYVSANGDFKPCDLHFTKYERYKRIIQKYISVNAY